MKYSNIITRKLLPVLAIVMIATFSGCKKFLDTPRQGEYNEENYPYPGGAGPYDQFILGAYTDLRGYNVHADGFIVATSIRSDDADKGSTASDGGPDVITMDNFPVLTNNGRANALWTGYYGLINKCNNTIHQITIRNEIVATEEAKMQARAEARFIRGYGYFMLVRLFGRVPKIDTLFADPAAQNNVPQSTPAEIYSLIESDLTFAASFLPAEWDKKFIGRATSGAANGILAKVYLTQKKWAMAKATAALVMNSGKYDLSTPYATIFGESGENSKESVFEIQGRADAQIKTDQGIQYASIQGVRGATEWNMGWGWNTPSTFLEAAYEANDPRKARTILYTSTPTTPGITIYGETTPLGLPNPRYNQKVYTLPSERARVNDRFGYWMNVRILRYADIVLMFAEASNEMGGADNIEAARVALNTVRARARTGAPVGTLADRVTTDQGELRDFIRHERRIELAMEHDRFFDIVRWGIADDAMHNAGKPNFSAARDALLPIPQAQIDLSNNVLTQNFGY
ncbi:RagB/SusD family nutrient uptake outer membrane protein [Terrimonas sp. NA20]|uniref:RagB/SusD family nutrient uptake outer membrane protein n=1 Tax=Terrimonas ginsenosidimutans TaxID=2908004 RepID=A0ABS9KUB5_9BACT|nr:RagB/SusD family nutrient uptake outer membrane protein [Terrimonas ginsenosidimutans]MCG2615921.1 RagB/SusD family nutrient uptake outer membrane protein [Terrimonas ginsenosidimutans]